MQRTENKARARVSEIFTSIEGEGIFVGKKTLFIRFSGCHLKCRWCDTKYALPLDSGTDYQIDEIKDLIIKELQPFTYKVNFTGGEPLLQTEAVIELADFVKKQTNVETYLESSCFDSELFSKVLPYIDICKIEFKTDDSKVVEDEEYDNLILNEIKCLELAVESNKATYIKIVVTNSTNLESFKNLVYNISEKIKPSDILGLIIQPSFGIDQPTVNKLLDTYDIVQPMFPEVRIIPQLHKEIGAK
ncbi:MAG: 7-carboxy-7-deazaguanine synthase QueE [Nitrososphaeraceae archaeon]|jgi:7-carboxy-7-deazaguanine synthase|nr:7-carboxy-7-deazaguanine synthase QueE [Nitrososphaeraceae archaeon]MDW0141518.1 7-carboxy-7-deazaguanine synthase QueE [Nitrososphaeraceae archaeon]MDW0143471.1 7-carboxy-7-deazaguanine synthase QueE [Nitrososphaeraceae archaeon]MDW0147908.1 7-carboxy-7-deazaguanine synthase QueE [Nitrososphaeraceae archaeon]MDW0154555.1 7-carboxy-7-deazaguanine synthase QueE [Nitrososphaeraceae archaeon]